ncbi:unnamed protein product [Spirodela intermedia]|uniref:ubiquitinyl hydrolase 1 n=1 Tax=Spirodela intermedia TaxID=51605 RepID=A0A7I8J2F0_SPIIN|nr:unnamed protein product [Spirodela intermedia]CAA6663983.1 unnamed protein product [Spirodela intermedia]
MLFHSKEEIDEKDLSDVSTLSPDNSPPNSTPTVSSWEERWDVKSEDVDFDIDTEVTGKFPLVEDEARYSELLVPSSSRLSLPGKSRDVKGLYIEYQHFDIDPETMKFPLSMPMDCICEIPICRNSDAFVSCFPLISFHVSLSFPFGEPLFTLIDEYQSGSVVFLEKIKIIGENYVSLRRTRRDGNCFFRCLWHIQESIKTLRNLQYVDHQFSNFYEIFTELLDGVIQGHEKSLSDELLLQRCQDGLYSDSAVMFCRCAASAEIQSRRDFFEPFLAPFIGTSQTLEQFCKTSVEGMKQESDHAHIVALTDALGVPVRVVYLDSSFSGTGPMTANQHDFLPSGASAPGEKPFISLLYRPGHYDILYPK